MKRLRSSTLLAGLALVVALTTLYVAVPARAQGGTGNQLVVRPQDVSNGQVVVDSFNAPTDGWLLIQRSASSGAPGAVIGFAPVHTGLNQGIRISVRTEQSGRKANDENSNNSTTAPFITPTLYASFAPDAGAASPLASPPSGIEQRATLRATFGSSAASPNAATTSQGNQATQTGQGNQGSQANPSSQALTTGGQTTSNNGLVVRSQDVSNGQVIVDSFNAPATGWLLIQRSSNGSPGAVIGFAPVHAGLNQSIRVDVRTERSGRKANEDENSNNSTISPQVTPTLFASYAADAGAASPLASPPSGIEGRTSLRVAFGSSAPSPNVGLASQSVTTGGQTSSTTGAPRIVVRPQNVPNVEAARNNNLANFVVVDSANATQDGWLFIRSSAGGQPGPVIGYAPVRAGLNQGLTVAIQLGRHSGADNPGGATFDYITSVLWATLTADPSANVPFATPSAAVQDQGWYAAVPFSSSGQTTSGGQSTSGAQAGALTTGGQANPSSQPAATGRNQIVARAQDLLGNQVILDSVTADQVGWVLIHSDANGRPGNVIGYAPVFPGVNRNVTVNLTLSSTNRSNRENITQVLWATLNPDPAAAFPFATPSAAVQTSGVAQAAFSSTAAGGVSANANQGSSSGTR